MTTTFVTRHQGAIDWAREEGLLEEGSRIAADLGEQGGTLEFHYSLDVNTALVSENDVYVAVFPR